MAPAPGAIPPIRVFVVEDDELIRASLLDLLADGGFEVVGSAGNVQEAVDALKLTEADIALVDLGLGGESGVDVILQLAPIRANLEFMVHTVFDDRENVFRALKAGASSYVLKGSSSAELCAALKELRAGGSPMSPRIARLVIRDLQAEPDPISPRERQILRQIDAGLTYKEIAAELNISVHTVHSHIKSVYERLQARGKRDAVAVARKRGLL